MPAPVRRRAGRVVAALLAAYAGAASAALPSAQAQFDLASNGRFAELARRLGEVPLATLPALADVHALCVADVALRAWDDLAPCLDEMSRRIALGDRHTRFFDLEDARSAVALMRATRDLDLGRDAEADDEAARALTLLDDDDDAPPDMRLSALAIRGIAAAHRGERPGALRWRAALVDAESSLMRNSSAVRSARAAALARLDLALGDWQAVDDELSSDVSFGVQSTLDNAFSGATLRGLDAWRWQSLPRVWMRAKAALELGRFDDARAGFDRLLALPEIAQSGEIERLVLADRARVAVHDGNLALALDDDLLALSLVERERRTSLTEWARVGDLGDHQALYARAESIALRLGRVETALEIGERARSRALVDLLATRQHFASHAAAAPDAPSADKLVALADAAEGDAGVSDPSRAREALARAAAAQDELVRRYPDVAALVRVSTRPWRDLRGRLRDDEVALVCDLIGDELAVFALSRQGVRASTVDATGLVAGIAEFRRAIAARDPAVARLARALYERIVRPVEAELAGRSLVIVASGPLRYLPFAALNDGKQWLVESHALRSLPSLARLSETTAAAPRGIEEDELVAYGLSAGVEPGSERVARAVAARELGATVRAGADATRDRFIADAAAHRFVDLDVPCRLDPQSPLRSVLTFYGDDGRLGVDALFALQVPADVVVVAACETGQPAPGNGDEVGLLASGFLAAGAHAVLAGLWDAGADSTAALLVEFHSATRFDRRSQALRKAQRALLATHPQPADWAALLLTGSDE